MELANHPHSTTNETPFGLVYGCEAVIPVELEEPSWRCENFQAEGNEQLLRDDLDGVEEKREMACIWEVALKQRVASKYNTWVITRRFEEGDLVLRRVDVGIKNAAQGKLAPSWERPYRIVERAGK